MAPQLLLATGNRGKQREFRALLQGAPWELVDLQDLHIQTDVPETGTTYLENAVLKARAYAELSGLPSLSDDSGLEVDALEGAPGIRSARYAPQPNATDADRRAFLLQQLHGRPRPWTARFRCLAVVAFPDGGLIHAEGVCAGEIIPEERGRGGFGYDPIFLLPSGLTMAELSAAEKNRLSHRAQAVRAVLQKLAG